MSNDVWFPAHSTIIRGNMIISDAPCMAEASTLKDDWTKNTFNDFCGPPAAPVATGVFINGSYEVNTSGERIGSATEALYGPPPGPALWEIGIAVPFALAVVLWAWTIAFRFKRRRVLR